MVEQGHRLRSYRRASQYVQRSDQPAYTARLTLSVDPSWLAHFVDLSRYFGGEVLLDSISAHSVEWYEKPGQLSLVSDDPCLTH